MPCLPPRCLHTRAAGGPPHLRATHRPQILGLGRTGHIGFNEKHILKTSATRLVTLDRRARGLPQAAPRAGLLRLSAGVLLPLLRSRPPWPHGLPLAAAPCRVTRVDAASDFFGEVNVPRRAITMGVGTILKVVGVAPGVC